MIDRECERVLSLLDSERSPGFRPAEIIDQLKHTMGENVGVVRNASGLHQALMDIERICSEDLPSMSLANHDRAANYDWIQAIEAISMLKLSEVITTAAFERKESRGAHFREDFETQDDERWKRNIIIQSENGVISTKLSPLIVEAE